MNQSAISSLSELFDTAYDGIFVMDAERRVVLFNQACERLTGRPANEVIGTACACPQPGQCHAAPADSLAASLCPGAEVFDGSPSAPARCVEVDTGAGQRRCLETQYVAVRDSGGRPKCVIGVLREGNGHAEGSAPTMSLDERLADIERRAILDAIRRANGRRNLAARLMGISRSRLYRRLEALGINPDDEPLSAASTPTDAPAPELASEPSVS